MRSLAFAAVVSAALAGAPARGEIVLTAKGPFGSTVAADGSLRARGELVDWFDPLPASPQQNDRYGFYGQKAQLGLRVTRAPFQFYVQGQHSLLAGVPSAAPGPGGAYFAASPDDFQHRAFVRQLWAQVAGGPELPLSLAVGRHLYRDGLEAKAIDPDLQWIKELRIAERLIGPFDYTHMGRSFDGVVASYESATLDVTAFGLQPTTGGFEVDAGSFLDDVRAAGLSATLKESPSFPRSDARAFYLYYGDERPALFVDNRPLAVRRADHGDAHIHSFGFHVAHVEPLGPGRGDVLFWAVGQLGDWQRQDHAAYAFAVEGGYRFAEAPWHPWIRAGSDMGSGDGNPNDGDHATFFQILPTARVYARTPFFNMMNSMDAFVQLLLEPHPKLTVRVDLHWLEKSDEDDLLYSGGGAQKKDVFGFAGLPANGRSEIAAFTDVSLTWSPVSWVSVTAYYGHAWGQDAFKAGFAGSDLDYGYLETTLRF